MAGGIVLSLGNLATQYAWAFVGLSVTEVISSSITVVIGSMGFVISRLMYFLNQIHIGSSRNDVELFLGRKNQQG